MTTVPTDVPASSPSSTDPAAHTAAFMTALLDTAPRDHHALLWTLQDKKSTWVPLRYGITGGPSCITETARVLSDAGKDVYVAVSAAAQPGLHDTRIKSANPAGIFGLWADIDIADPDVHKKWNLPPTLEAALELLDMVELEPTLVVHSGHGLQAWWLFHEFWAFDTETARLEAAGLAQRWNTTLQQRAATNSCGVESTLRHAYFLDYWPILLVDGTMQAGAPSAQQATLFNVESFFGWTMRSQDLLQHLSCSEVTVSCGQ